MSCTIPTMNHNFAICIHVPMSKETNKVAPLLSREEEEEEEVDVGEEEEGEEVKSRKTLAQGKPKHLLPHLS